MIFGPMAWPSQSRLFSGLALHRVVLIAVFFAGVFSARAQQKQVPPLPPADKTKESTQVYYANAHPYLNEQIEQLIKRIPELDGLKPAADQQPLATILQRTGQRVEESFRTVFDLTSKESITEEKVGGTGKEASEQTVQANYLILQRGAPSLGRVEEYRMDDSGKRMLEPGLTNEYFVTSNFAWMRAYLSTAWQPEMEFRYLGEQSVGARPTYVVAFAQKPEAASLPMRLEGNGGATGHYRVDMLVQGVAWIDLENAEVVRMRTDLLAPRPEIGLDELTTTVNSSEVHLAEIATPLWLPSEVEVTAEFSDNGQRGWSQVVLYHNEHRYSDYQLYRVSAPEAAPLTLDDRARHGNDLVITPEKADLNYYANAHPYLEDTRNELVKQIPELAKMKPVTDQTELPGILQKTGANVDSFFANVVDVIADEKITMQRWTPRGFSALEHVGDSYLILRKPRGNRHEMVEYRMDAAGQRLDNVGLNHGFVTTRGFALACNFFASGWQHESTFRYLGDEKTGSRDSYVVGFAQKPGVATLLVTMRAANGGQYPVLIQGIAWIDKLNFQIVRMRTDLLAPHPELALERQTTDVTFGAVQLVDVATPLWLPKDVKVYVTFKEHGSGDDWVPQLSYRNEHHYSDYRHYGVSVKMVAPK